MLTFQDVTRTYGRRIAVDNLNLHLTSGELFELLGHNGAGKTTTIKMLVGLLAPSAGKITVGPYELENVLVSIPAAGQDPELFEKTTEIGTRISSRQASAGLLGYEILQHFVVTVDYHRGHVHFYPGEKISAE